MSEVIMFLENSIGNKKTYECPELPEAPEGSIFHRLFDISTLKIRKTINSIEFLNPQDDEVAVVVEVKKSDKNTDAIFHVTELSIRSFQVFKNIELKISDNNSKLSVGLESNGKKCVSSI